MPQSKLQLKAAFCLLLLILAGCTSTGPELGSRLVGSWEGQLGSFTVTTIYTDTDVAVEGQAPLPYTLEGDLLVIDGDRTTARRVSFPSRQVMVQVDAITGTVHEFSRVP